MAHDFLAALKEEIDNLEEALSRDIRAIRLKELRRVLSLYETRQPSEPAETHPKPSRASGGRRPSPERERALEGARLFLVNRIGPTPTRDILAHLESLNVEIGGEVPANNLSAMLSNSNQFIAHGRNGWTLTPAEFPNVINSILSELTPETAVEIARQWDEREGIPADIDGKLLARARDALGRDLLDAERTHLRLLLANSAKVLS